MANDIPDEMFKRLVLANQYRMLALLERNSGAFWQIAVDMAEQGWPVENLPGARYIEECGADPLTREDQTFVLDIFQIYQLLQDAADTGMVPADGYGVDFPGFDGNHESVLMGYARHLVHNEDRFAFVRSAGDDYNSHWPMVGPYREMVAAWHRQGQPLSLSRSQFDEIIAERTRRVDALTGADAL